MDWPLLILPLSFGKNQQRGEAMKDYQAQLEKLRRDAAECALIRDLATDKAKRALFDRLAAHLGTLADQVEIEMLHRKAGETHRSKAAFSWRPLPHRRTQSRAPLIVPTTEPRAGSTIFPGSEAQTGATNK